jgi:hypothetical protein
MDLIDKRYDTIAEGNNLSNQEEFSLLVKTSLCRIWGIFIVLAAYILIQYIIFPIKV